MNCPLQLDLSPDYICVTSFWNIGGSVVSIVEHRSLHDGVQIFIPGLTNSHVAGDGSVLPGAKQQGPGRPD